MMSLLHKLLLHIDPERSHCLGMQGLQLAYATGLSRYLAKPVQHPVTLMGLTFPNQVGLAAGLDKNGDYIDALAALGFGAIEIGTLTPKPQIGNPKPRLFRLNAQAAIINRMGFNNKGIAHAEQQLKKMAYRGMLGINIGKNKDTPNDKALDDYLLGFRTLWPYASYITINISSPNTPGLRELQQAELLSDLLKALKQEQALIADQYKKYVPLVVKIAPDLTRDELGSLAEVFLQQEMDGVIATNTTIERDGVESSVYAREMGGLSGRPLAKRSTEVIRELKNILQDTIPIIASGGVMDRETAREKLSAGAKFLQVYTGFIYKGAGIIEEIAG